MADKIKFVILDDGTLKADTPTISGANHMAAEALMRNIGQELGAKPDSKQKHGHTHHHNHEHEHEGGGHGHSHDHDH